jgi:hypothetical protein
MPLCLWGGSAGGQLALIAAAVRAYDCVISEAGPIDLVGVEHQTANGSPVGPLQGFLHAITVFGLENLWKKSPLSVASQIEGRLLLATGKFDPVIPLEQMAEMKAARPSTKTMELEGGGPTDPYFVHAHISAEAKQRFESAVDATLSGARQDVAGYYARPTSVKFAARNKGAWFSSRLRVSVAVSGSVSRVEFRVDGKRVAGDRRKPFGFTYRPARKIALGRHRLSAVAFPLSGRAVAASTRVQRVQPQSLRSACAKAKRRVRAAPTARARRAARLARDRRCP